MRVMRVLRTLLLTALVVLSSRIVHADELYTLTINLTVSTAAFEDGTYTFQEPSLLTSPTTITTGITNTGHDVQDIIIDPTGGSCPFVSLTVDPLLYMGCEEVDFPTGMFGGLLSTLPFTKEGTYIEDLSATHLGNITLTITPVASTPEPSTITLLGSGILCLAGLVRRRLS